MAKRPLPDPPAEVASRADPPRAAEPLLRPSVTPTRLLRAVSASLGCPLPPLLDV